MIQDLGSKSLKMKVSIHANAAKLNPIREATYIYVNASNIFRDISSQKSHSSVFYFPKFYICTN